MNEITFSDYDNNILWKCFKILPYFWNNKTYLPDFLILEIWQNLIAFYCNISSSINHLALSLWRMKIELRWNKQICGAGSCAKDSKNVFTVISTWSDTKCYVFGFYTLKVRIRFRKCCKPAKLEKLQKYWPSVLLHCRIYAKRWVDATNRSCLNRKLLKHYYQAF